MLKDVVSDCKINHLGVRCSGLVLCEVDMLKALFGRHHVSIRTQLPFHFFLLDGPPNHDGGSRCEL